MAVEIDPSMQDSFEEYLTEFEQGRNRGIGITLRSDYQENFRNARMNMVLVPLIVGLVLMSIALLNFLNLLIAKAISRQQEFAVYQSLGMTLAQLRRLLLLEGLYYAALMTVVLIPLTVLFAKMVMPGVITEFSWVSAYRFTLAPLWITMPVIVLLAVLAPLVCMGFVTRGTIQQRLRTGE